MVYFIVCLSVYSILIFTSSNEVCVMISVGAWNSFDSVFSLSLWCLLLFPDVKAEVIFLLT